MMVFERLFRASHPKKATLKRDRLLLDRVLTDTQELKQQLGASDRQRMDEYLQSVRSIEKRLQNQQSGGIKNWRPRVELNPDDRPQDDAPDQYPEQVHLMLDMIALAFQTDTTRVCTFMFGNAVRIEWI